MRTSLTVILVLLLIFQAVEKSQSALPGDLIGSSTDSTPTATTPNSPTQTSDQQQTTPQQTNTPDQTQATTTQAPTGTTPQQTTDNPSQPNASTAQNTPAPTNNPQPSDNNQQTPSSTDDNQPARGGGRRTKTAQQPSDTSSTDTSSTESSSSPPSSSPSSDNNSNTATIAGSVVGGLVGIALIAGLVTWVNRRTGCTGRTNRRNDYEKQEDIFSTDGAPPGNPGQAASPFQRPLVPTYGYSTLGSEGTGSPPPQNLEMYDSMHQHDMPIGNVGSGYQHVDEHFSHDQPPYGPGQYYTPYGHAPEETVAEQKPDTVDHKPHQV